MTVQSSVVSATRLAGVYAANGTVAGRPIYSTAGGTMFLQYQTTLRAWAFVRTINASTFEAYAVTSGDPDQAGLAWAVRPSSTTAFQSDPLFRVTCTLCSAVLGPAFLTNNACNLVGPACTAPLLLAQAPTATSDRVCAGCVICATTQYTVSSCPQSPSECVDCSPSCATCRGSAAQCTSCGDGLSLWAGKCLTACPPGTANNVSLGVCQLCNMSAASVSAIVVCCAFIVICWDERCVILVICCSSRFFF